MQYKYISDLHLFDPTSFDWRDGMPVMDYACLLVDSWNAFTDPDDVVIVVGDIGHPCPYTIKTLQKLNGKKILVLGNHDLSWGPELYTCGVFSGIYESIEQNNIYINHIPEDYHGNCQFYVHGHHHRYDMPGMYKKLQRYAANTYQLNCAADMNNNRPCTLQELILNKELNLERYREMGILGGN